MKEQIEFSEFLEIEKRLEIKVGMICVVEEIPKSDKLLKLTVHFGELNEETDAVPVKIGEITLDEKYKYRTVVTNIKPQFRDIVSAKKELEQTNFLFVTNLKPVKIMGIESTAMILPGELENGIMATVHKRIKKTIPEYEEPQSLKIL